VNLMSTFRMTLLLIGAWTVPTVLAGCSADSVSSDGTDASTNAGSGGKGSGGNGSGGRPVEAGTGEGDGGCVAPNYLVYHSPGCDGTVMPQCSRPPGNDEDGGLTEACACDGTRILGGGGFLKPYRHLGECSMADSGSD
jgi:hypothetical protein